MHKMETTVTLSQEQIIERDLARFARELTSVYSEHFSRIWVQRSKYSLCLTLFPVDRTQTYKIVVKKAMYHGFSQLTTYEELVSLVNMNI